MYAVHTRKLHYWHFGYINKAYESINIALTPIQSLKRVVLTWDADVFVMVQFAGLSIDASSGTRFRNIGDHLCCPGIQVVGQAFFRTHVLRHAVT